MPNIISKEKILKRRAGALVPLFSVYSANSFGIGDFEDLKILVDWCVKTGLSILQLLPMNDLSPTFCPYDSISSFALDPMYISLKGKGKVKGSHVDYRVKEEKIKLLWNIYISQAATSSDNGFKKFCEENSYWLDDFSLYKALKNYHKSTPWYEWNEGYKNRDSYILNEFIKEHEKELSFYKWAQWLAYKQFKFAGEYAGSKGVLLKGDLPVLVSRDSADVWAHPDFFKLEYAAGAPPDMYCAKGQRWGMPTYNWEKIEADNFTYIKEKLKFAENFYEILRIDHVAGLFRIWSIPCSEPMENQGLNGFFDPKDENLWASRGKKLLSVLKDNTKMVLCAEDLGIIPKSCRDTLEELGIPGNDVQRWTKDWKVKHDFLTSGEYRRLSVAMLSTHDTTTFAAWWENEAGTVNEALFARKCNERGIDYRAVRDKLFDASRSDYGRLRWHKAISSSQTLVDILGHRPEELKDFIELYEDTYMEKEKLWKRLKIKGAMREKSDPDIIRAALEITQNARSIFCIELIFDLLGLAALLKEDPYRYRINKPGTVSPENWSVRIPLSLEELLKHRVNKDIKEVVVSGGRKQPS